MSARDWGWGGEEGGAVAAPPRARRPGPGGSALIDRLLSDLGSDPDHWFAERERLREAMKAKRGEIASLRRQQAEHEAMYESHGQQPSMYENLRKIELAKAMARAVAAAGKKLAEWEAETVARQDREYTEFVDRHHRRKEVWLQKKQDESKLWAELKEIEDEHAAAIDKVQMLKSLIFYLGQEARAI